MFKTGDRVVYVGILGCSELVSDGDTGTVIGTDKGLIREDSIVYVDWDRNVGGHSCQGLCERGHGWNVLSSRLKLLDDAPAIDREAFLCFLTGEPE